MLGRSLLLPALATSAPAVPTSRGRAGSWAMKPGSVWPMDSRPPWPITRNCSWLLPVLRLEIAPPGCGGVGARRSYEAIRMLSHQTDDQKLFGQTIDYYHCVLKGSPTALDYLQA